MANRISRAIGNFTGAVGEMQRAKKNMKELKPKIAARKKEVARLQFERGIGPQPRKKSEADRVMLGWFR